MFFFYSCLILLLVKYFIWHVWSVIWFNKDMIDWQCVVHGGEGWSLLTLTALVISGLYGAREDNRGRHTDNPLGATPSWLSSNPPPSSPIFTPDALPAATLPIYPGLGQAPNMLACIPSGLIYGWGMSVINLLFIILELLQLFTITSLNILLSLILQVMAALWHRAGHYIFILWFLLFFPRLISAVADWMSIILLHMVWP